MFKFNNGMGAYICDCCRIIIHEDTIKVELKEDRELHFCSELCKNLYKLKDRKDRKVKDRI